MPEGGVLLNLQKFFDDYRLSLIISVIYWQEEQYLFIYCINVIPKVTLTWKRDEGVPVGYSQIHTQSCDQRHPMRNRSATWQTDDNK